MECEKITAKVGTILNLFQLGQPAKYANDARSFIELSRDKLSKNSKELDALDHSIYRDIKHLSVYQEKLTSVEDSQEKDRSEVARKTNEMISKKKKILEEGRVSLVQAKSNIHMLAKKLC